jgi:RHS repeat-associated protein
VLGSSDAFALNDTVYVQAKPLYNDGWIGSGTPMRTDLGTAFSDVEAISDQCTYGYGGASQCNTISNLRGDPSPTAIIVNDSPSLYVWDALGCSTPAGGSTTCDWTYDVWSIDARYVCPDQGYLQFFTTGTYTRQAACAVTYLPPPPPRFILSSIGDPIFASTGQEMKRESDYSGPSGLDFTRTYWSTNGFFASVLTQVFVDGSVPGLVDPQCYSAHWTYSSTLQGWWCFPYLTSYSYMTDYVLQSADGRSFVFTGPPTAVTSSVDVNDRVTQITVAGATEWQVQREDDSIEIYNPTGSLIQKTLRGGRNFTYVYSTSSTPSSIAPKPGLLLTQSDAFGHTLCWQYNSLGEMTQMTDPGGGLYSYSYDTDGNMTGVTYPDGTSKTYWYNESANTGGANIPSALTGVTDENGVRYATIQYSNSYSGSALLATNMQLAGGVDNYSLSYEYSWAGVYMATVTDPLGTVRNYFPQDINNLSYADDVYQRQPAASGSGTVGQTEGYDSNGNINYLSDFNGNVTTYVFDLTRNLETSRTEAYGTAQARTITTSWNASWRQPALITEPNRTTAFTYDSLGNVLTKTVTDTTVTPNVSRVWTYTYDSYGRMLTAQGPRTDVSAITSFTYYTCTTGSQCGQVQTITDALGHVTTFNTYNAHGQPLTVTDPNGVVTTLTYDMRQRVLSRQIGSESTSYAYTPAGQLSQVTLPDGGIISYTYDGAHRLITIADGAGNSISYTLDAIGNHIVENAYDPTGTLHRTHTRVFNALNELSQDINSAGSSAVTTNLSYDNDGNLTNSAAPLSRTTSTQYDALNRLTQITDPSSGVTALTYDANDNLAAVTDPRSLSTSYGHNGFGDVTQVVSPDTGTTTNTYDSGGNLASTTDARGAEGTYSYDALNRVTQVAHADQTITFTYDSGTNAVGRLTQAADANHSMAWDYDAQGRVIGKGQTLAAGTESAGYAYTNDDLVAMETPSGQLISFTYTNHQITGISVNGATLLNTVTYDPFGPVTGWTWGNGTTVTRAYDEDGNPNQFVTAGVTNGYTLDAASRITALSDSGVSSNSFSYNYDVLDRVTGGASTALTRGYGYDADGNTTAIAGTAVSSLTIASASNQISATTGSLARTYTYDAAGNTTGYGSNSYTFNDRGRLSQATVSGAYTNYIYNALGQLIEKYGTGGTTIIVYDEAGHILGEYTSTGALIQETVWMGDIPVATIVPSGSSVAVYYVHTDHLNTPRKISRPSDNALMWRWDPDTYGSVGPNQSPSGLGTFVYNLRFPGQYYLPETGLFYNYFRDYDPQMGRYIESDPIGLAGGNYSTYGYDNSNPLTFMDPSGLSTAIADRGAGVLTVTFNDGTTVTYPVGNNTVNPIGDPNTVNSNGPAPVGTFPVQPPVNTGNSVSYGPFFFPIGAVNANGTPADIARRRGIGLHGGRRNHNSRTEGCLRLDNADISDLVERTIADPLTSITIE